MGHPILQNKFYSFQLMCSRIKNLVGVLVKTCNPSYSGGGGRRITRSSPAWEKEKGKTKIKGLGHGLSDKALV
jgi:hypothetical protein